MRRGVMIRAVARLQRAILQSSESLPYQAKVDSIGGASDLVDEHVLIHARDEHAVRMRCALRCHAVRMRCACGAHAVPMRCSRHACAWKMRSFLACLSSVKISCDVQGMSMACARHVNGVCTACARHVHSVCTA